ncbi:hypothetical protein [Butyrivibrio sp. AE3009]|uniref:hypothetical protein n=1 Tax=Butyrivibrio sp. AE3009 TaxID=1280666 RepID=UPI0003B4FBE4|nr:hypothetical protein [Butyrivibrio sp. AE3009]
MESQKEETTLGVYLNYLKSEAEVGKRIIIYFGIYIVLVAVFYALYWMAAPQGENTEVSASQIVNQIVIQFKEMVDNQTHTEHGFNIFMFMLFVISIFGIPKGIMHFFPNSYRSDIDYAFSSTKGIGIKDIKRIISCGLALSFAYLIIIGTNIINFISTEEGGKIPRWSVMVLALVILAVAIVTNWLRAKAEGRDNLLAYIQTIPVMISIIAYPVKEYNLRYIAIYIGVFTCLTVKMMWDIGKLSFDKVVCCIKNYDSNGDLYIHYRLDDERVVCSRNQELTKDSKPSLYNINALCRKEIESELTDGNKIWHDSVRKITTLRKEKRENKKIEKTNRKAEKAKKKAETKALKAEKKAKKEAAKLENTKLKEEMKELQNQIVELKSINEKQGQEIINLKTENERLKTPGKGA